MFILRRALVLSPNADNKAYLPSPKKFQLQTRIFGTDKNQSTNMDPKREVTYEELLKKINTPKMTIVDVRNPDEVDSTGLIPSSINIPVDNLKNTLSMSECEFRQQYNREKPSVNDEIVFYCRSGKRASVAMEQALSMGYNKSKTYLGSWTEWSDKRK